MAKAETQATGDPVWEDHRLLPAGFGIQPAESQVVQSATPPSGNAVQVADDTPLHGWAPSRQWLPNAGPAGWAGPGALEVVEADIAGERRSAQRGG